LRKLFGVGKPKTLQGTRGLAALAHFVIACWRFLYCTARPVSRLHPGNRLSLHLTFASSLSQRFKTVTSRAVGQTCSKSRRADEELAFRAISKRWLYDWSFPKTCTACCAASMLPTCSTSFLAANR